MRRGRQLGFALAVALGLALSLHMALTMGLDGGDYEIQAGPAIDALVRGDLDGFFANYPVIGTLSLALRAPIVALVFHADVRVVYLAGAALCFVPVVALALWLVRRLAERDESPAAALAVAALVIASPLTFRVLHWGHPEDFLAATGIVAAAIAAMRGRSGAAGLMLGLAVASKQWALLAAPLILVGARPRWALTLAVAAAVSFLAYLPLAVGDLDRFVRVMKAASNPQALNRGDGVAQARAVSGSARIVPGMTHVTPLNIWWPFAQREAGVDGKIVSEHLVVGAHALAALFALLMSILLARRRRGAEDLAAALALVFLVRCMLDPLDFDYHHLPFFLALAAWEALRRDGLPVLTAGVVLAFGVTLIPVPYIYADLYAHATYYNVVYLAWSVPVALFLAGVLLRGERKVAQGPGTVRTYVR